MSNGTQPPGHFARIVSLTRTGPIPILKRFLEQGTRIVRGYPVWQWTRITSQLYVGGQHRRRGWEGMQKEGITAIVNMREGWHNDMEQNIGGERHLHIQTIDNTPPTLEDLKVGADFIAEEIARGGKVYVHCGVGVGRAPTMAAAYLISTGMPPDAALAKIKAVRPFIHLTSDQRAQLDVFTEWIHSAKGG